MKKENEHPKATLDSLKESADSLMQQCTEHAKKTLNEGEFAAYIACLRSATHAQLMLSLEGCAKAWPEVLATLNKIEEVKAKFSDGKHGALIVDLSSLVSMIPGLLQAMNEEGEDSPSTEKEEDSPISEILKMGRKPNPEVEE